MLMYLFGAIAVVLATIFIVIRAAYGGLYGVYTKALASVGFLTLGLVGVYVNGMSLVAFYLLLGLIFGLLGDIVLDLKIVYNQDKDKHLNAGMSVFAAGHIFYFVALTSYLANTIFVAKMSGFLLIAFGIAMFITVGIMTFAPKMLKLDFGKFKVQTAIYTFMLSFMTAYSFAAAFYIHKLFIFAAGMLLFFLSDMVLSNQYFGKYEKSKLFIVVNHALYYLAQITIAVMIFFL